MEFTESLDEDEHVDKDMRKKASSLGTIKVEIWECGPVRTEYRRSNFLAIVASRRSASCQRRL